MCEPGNAENVTEYTFLLGLISCCINVQPGRHVKRSINYMVQLTVYTIKYITMYPKCIMLRRLSIICIILCNYYAYWPSKIL